MKRHVYVQTQVVIPKGLRGLGEQIEDNSDKIIKASWILTHAEKLELLDANSRRCSAEWGYIRERIRILAAERDRAFEEKEGYKERVFFEVGEELRQLCILLASIGYSTIAIANQTRCVVSKTSIARYTIEAGRQAHEYKRNIIVELSSDFADIDLKKWKEKRYDKDATETKRKYKDDDLLRVIRDYYLQGVDSIDAARILRISKTVCLRHYKTCEDEDIRKGVAFYESDTR